MSGIFLLLGSNIGDSQAILKRAREMIELEIGDVIKSSSIYQTKAWGMEEQADFLNQVLEIASGLTPEKLLNKINQIEVQLGRVRIEKWHERIIDIDILYFGDMVMDTKKLQIPHPENQNRNFVLAPMTEIAPDFIHPVLEKSQSELLECSTDRLAVVRLS